MARKIDDKKLLEMHSEGIQGKDIAQHFGVSPAAGERLAGCPNMQGR